MLQQDPSKACGLSNLKTLLLCPNIWTCHCSESTGGSNNINDGRLPFSLPVSQHARYQQPGTGLPGQSALHYTLIISYPLWHAKMSAVQKALYCVANFLRHTNRIQYVLFSNSHSFHHFHWYFSLNVQENNFVLYHFVLTGNDKRIVLTRHCCLGMLGVPGSVSAPTLWDNITWAAHSQLF